MQYACINTLYTYIFSLADYTPYNGLMAPVRSREVRAGSYSADMF